MKTRLRFKIIAVLICLSLAGLLISQGYWLKGLYVSSKKSTWDNIEKAMRMADYMELFLRLDSLSNNNFHSQINPQFSFSQDTAWEKRKDSLSTDNMPISSPNSTIQYIEAAQTLNEYLQIIGTLERNVQMLMHQKIDTLLPVNYAQFNTLLKNGLKKQGITVPYRLQVIRKEAKDSVLYAYTDASEKGESWKVGGATLNVESPRKTFLNFRNNLLMLYKNLPEKDLKHVMHARFWLDYIAAAKFLLTGHYPNARAVYEARKAFHELKPSYEPVRRENLAKTKLSGIPELRKGSLILAFYLQGKKRFTEL